MTSDPKYPQFAIASSASLSDEMDLFGTTLNGIIIPAAFTGTAVSFKVSNVSGGTYVPLNNSSGLVSISVSASNAYSLNPSDFAGWRFVKLLSNATESGARVVLAAARHLA